jgi:DNA-directed RNA polymerase specialized sigma24 family protein
MKDECVIGTYFDKKKLNLENVLKDYQNYMVAMIRDFGVEDSEDEEIISDVLLVVWKNSKKLNKNLKFSPYLLGITRMVILKRNYKLPQEIHIENYDRLLVSKFNIDQIIEEKDVNNWIGENVKKLRRYGISSIYQILLL